MCEERSSWFFPLSLLVLFFSIVIACPLYGQDAPAKATTTAPSAIITNVDEVSVDLLVHKKKKPVLDLKPEDIAITDNGSPVKLSDLRFVSGASGKDHPITFLFDSLDPSAATNAKDIARKILKVFPATGFVFSVFKVQGPLRLYQEFTTDRQDIEKAIHAATSDTKPSLNQTAAVAEQKLLSALQAGQSGPLSSEYDRALAQSGMAALMQSRRILQDQHTEPALAGLMALSRAMTVVPGHKLLVYFTEGLQSDAAARDMLQSIAGAANRAQVSICVVDKTALDTKIMEGLMAAQAMGGVAAFNRANPLPTGQAAQIPTTFGGGMVSMTQDRMTRTEGEGLAGNQSPLARMAESTGGAYIFSAENPKKPFRKLIADLSTYYEASYIPPKADYDGSFHQVTVKPLRAGLKIQSRAGYFALPPSGGIRPFEAELMKIFSAPQLPNDVKFRAAVLQLGNLITGNENTLVVEVPVSELESRSDANTNLLSWRVAIVSEVKDKAGNVVEHFSEDVPGHGALDAKDKAQWWVTMQRHFALPPGQYSLQTVVVDRFSGKIGGERSSITLSGASSGAFLSDVAIVRRVDPSPSELDPFEPLRYKDGKIVPKLAPQLSAGASDLSFFFLVHPDSKLPDAAMLELQVLRNGELFGQVPLGLPKELGEAFPYLASLKASSLPAGDYQVMVSLTQSGKLMEREARFSIAGPQLANAALAAGPARDSKLPDIEGAESDILPIRRHPLVITALPPDAVTRPSEEEASAIITGARQHALNYAAKLPNFLCVEITDRSVDPGGNGNWRRKDSFGELLRYVDKHETRATLEVNGHPSSMKRDDLSQWPLSLGEFGDLLNAVFEPSSKADFRWKETDALADSTVQVFEYRVDRNNNSMLLSDGGARFYAGFHGLVFIDSSTLGVRRVTMEADDLRPDFSIHAASLEIDYDYVGVGTHDYLMPVRGTIRLKRGRHQVDLNQIVFQNYRRYASQAKIVSP